MLNKKLKAQLETVELAAEDANSMVLDEKHARHARHAYREGDVYEMVTIRQKEEPYKSRRITIAIDLTKSRAQFVVRDQGKGFDVKSVTKNQDSNIAESNKRGITLIKNFMNDVSYNEDGTEIRMSLALH